MPIILTLPIAIIFLTQVQSIKAQTLQASEYAVNLSIEQDGSATGEISFVLNNNLADKLISGYELSLPFKNSTINAVTIDNAGVQFTTDQSTVYPLVKLNFVKDAIFPDKKKTIRMAFSSNKITDEYSAQRLFFVPKPFLDESNGKAKFTIDYASQFGDPLVINMDEGKAKPVVEGKRRIETESSEGLLIVWGDEVVFELESSFNLRNKKEEDENTIFNIIPEYANQQVSYHSVTGADFGLVDKYGSAFGYTTLIPNGDKNVGFKAKVILNAKDSGKDIFPEKYNFNFDEKSPPATEFIIETQTIKEKLEKIKKVHDILILRGKPDRNEKINVENLENVWQRLEKGEAMNAFEYCAVLSSYAEKLDVRIRIEYGYILYPNYSEFDITSPHVWCEASIDGEVILMDPFLQDVTGVTYFHKKAVDRIRMGTWHQSIDYNSALGLTPSSEGTVKIKILNQKVEAKANEEGVFLNMDFPKKAFSGEFYFGTLSVNNTTDKFIKISEVFIDNTNETSKFIFENDLKAAILPKQRSNFRVDYLRHPNFLFDGVRNIPANIIVEDKTIGSINSNVEVIFEPDPRIFLGVLVSLIIIITILMTILYKMRHRNSVYRLVFKTLYRITKR